MSKVLFNRKNNIIIAVILAVSLFVNVFFNITVPAFSASAENEAPYIVYNDQPATSVEIKSDEKLLLKVFSKEEVLSYQWQIEDPKVDDRWINITNCFSRKLWISYALLGSMLDESGTAQVRCYVQTKTRDTFTAPVDIKISYNVSEDTDYIPDRVNPPFSSIATLGIENLEEDFSTYSIVINYLFDNNVIAFEPYGASVAAGSEFKEEIPSPEVVGYAPFRRDGDNYIDASTVKFDLDSVNEDITINVIYEPALVDFSVHHHFQDVIGDDYSINYDRITKGQALTGTIVGDGLALTEDELPGFRALAYEKLPVAADGSTVIEVRYDRNYYLIDFDMNGGYGSEPVYTRYGAFVGANVPTRHGYVFDGWELVSYNGTTPTNEQKEMYAMTAGGTVEVPAANLSYRARWITSDTKYTMVFWRENANDSGYTYWTHIDEIPARSGSLVSGEDSVYNALSTQDKKEYQYFKYNDLKTDKDIIVEGDGSTVVNVYYTRNYYTLTFTGKTQKCGIEVGHKHTDECYDLICGHHIHDDSCAPTLTCVITEHIAHTDSCIVCNMQEHKHGNCATCRLAEHTHVKGCYRGVANNATDNLYGRPSNPANGQIYTYWGTSYIYVGGMWYKYTGRISNGFGVPERCTLSEHTHGNGCSCELPEHTHNDNCYIDDLHTHNEQCYSYNCGITSVQHVDACKRLICPLPEGHTHTSGCTNPGSNTTNTVKLVRAKYGQSLKDIWPIIGDNGVAYDDGERWDPLDTSLFTEVLVYMDVMPSASFKLNLSTSTYKPYTMNYYVEALPGENVTKTYQTEEYTTYKIIEARYNFVTKKEDFFNIHGFTQHTSDPVFTSDSAQLQPSDRIVDFYYMRNRHSINFYNRGSQIGDKEIKDIPYGMPLKDYYFEPEYPDNLEPNAYTFGGWYTTEQCFEGTKVDWENDTLPDSDMLLYAKWVPIKHTVRVFKDADLTQQIGADQIVDHRAFAVAPSGGITNGNYVFQGWFYMDEGVEKAFSFSGIPVVDDMDIYAKWSSHISVDYKINYKLFNTDIDIADPLIGSSLAGQNKTFDAKAGDQLYAGYQTGYYPMTSSHTVTMSAESDHEFTFYYVYVESMPYKVRYVNKLTGESLLPDKLVANNTLSIATETFERIPGMMPDSYQKRLILSADDEGVDQDGVYAANVITFYYTSDNEHAYYRVVHYIENISGDSYREYRFEDKVGDIGKEYVIDALNITGFTFNAQKTTVNGQPAEVDGTSVTTELGLDGALIEFYYDRNEYEYTVKYIDSKTNADIFSPKKGTALFGEQIVEYAENFEFLGYELISANAKTHTISTNADFNVIDFYYQEKTVAIRYQIVGPEESGTLSRYSENISAITGVTSGSIPTANKGFVFLGWYTNPQCTKPVKSDWVNEQNNQLVPQKQMDIWVPTTYYAKFAAENTELTITTKSTAQIDSNQAFIFNVIGKSGTDTEGVNLTVTVIGNSSVTITKLPVGEYTVTEITDWSWRYENSSAQREVTLEFNDGANELVFDNSRPNGKWLDGNAVKNNKFVN